MGFCSHNTRQKPKLDSDFEDYDDEATNESPSSKSTSLKISLELRGEDVDYEPIVGRLCLEDLEQ